MSIINKTDFSFTVGVVNKKYKNKDVEAFGADNVPLEAGIITGIKEIYVIKTPSKDHTLLDEKDFTFCITVGHNEPLADKYASDFGSFRITNKDTNKYIDYHFYNIVGNVSDFKEEGTTFSGCFRKTDGSYLSIFGIYSDTDVLGLTSSLGSKVNLTIEAIGAV